MNAKEQRDFDRIKKAIEDLKERDREQHDRIREELRFSNPAKPEQWGRDDLLNRSGRPSLTLDRTNQFIQQVVNDARMNNPAIKVVCSDAKASDKVAETLSGVIKHIEYRSRAGQAYDMAIELAARASLGWLRVVTEVVNEDTGEQDFRILRVTDGTACALDSDEADGAGATFGYIETRMTEAKFKAAYPKAKPVPAGESVWSADGLITICEVFEIVDESANHIEFKNENGEKESRPEADYWKLSDSTGANLPRIGSRRVGGKKVRWLKMSGAEFLEPETRFPGELIPLIPVPGYELWIDGKRYLSGLTRRLMDGQRLHNFQMSAMAEFLAQQPKAPFLMPAEAIEPYEDAWAKLNRGNPAYLPYAHLDESGNPLPPPQRLAPPSMPGAYAQMAQFAVTEMEASVGMYKSALGQQSNAVSGRAKLADERSSDVATFHFIDNQARAIEQLGRVIVGAIPEVYDTERIAHIVGADEKRSQVQLDPSGPAFVVDGKGKVIGINPTIGRYDVVVKSGPSYSTQREETAQQLSEMISQNPNLAPILGPMWVRMRDMPEGEKIARLMLAMAPPQVQQLESEEEELPAAAVQKIQLLEQQAQAMHQAIEQATAKLQELQSEDKAKTIEALAKAAELQIKEYDAETKRIQALSVGMTAQDVQALVYQTIQQAMQREPLQDGEEYEHAIQAQLGIEDEPHEEVEMPPQPMAPDDTQAHEMLEPPPIEAQEDTNEAPSGPFSLPEDDGPQD